MASLEEIRQKLQNQENKQQNQNNGVSQIYPFWNIKDNETAIVRFLPDGDQNNTFFWKERLIIKLPFKGVKGHDEDKPVTVQVPCMEMYGKTCPVLSEIRPWFQDEQLKELASKYWKKYSYLFQGFVVNDPMEEEKNEKAPENPIRRFVINKNIFGIIKDSLMDPDMEELPTDYTAGRDFKIKKTKRGQFADYSTSSWSQKVRSLSEEELEAINKHGLFTLKDFLPKEPDEEGVRVIKEMFEASVDDELYDPHKWGEYFKPYGLNIDTSSSNRTSMADTKSESENNKSDNEVSDALNKLRSKVNESNEDSENNEQETSSGDTKEEENTSSSDSDSEKKADANEVLKKIRERSQAKN